MQLAGRNTITKLGQNKQPLQRDMWQLYTRLFIYWIYLYWVGQLHVQKICIPPGPPGYTERRYSGCSYCRYVTIYFLLWSTVHVYLDGCCRFEVLYFRLLLVYMAQKLLNRQYVLLHVRKIRALRHLIFGDSWRIWSFQIANPALYKA